jgi:predicted transcriptional regulator
MNWILLILVVITLAYQVCAAHEKYWAFRDAILALLTEEYMTFSEIRDCLEMISNSYLRRILNDLAREQQIREWGGGYYQLKKEWEHEVE